MQEAVLELSIHPPLHLTNVQSWWKPVVTLPIYKPQILIFRYWVRAFPLIQYFPRLMDFSVDRITHRSGVGSKNPVRVIESWNVLGWEGPTRITKPNSWRWSQWPGMGSKGTFLDCAIKKEGDCSFTPGVGREGVGWSLVKVSFKDHSTAG